MKKNENFKRIAEKRVIKILEQLRLVGNLSNQNNYEYSEEEVSKIFKTLTEGLNLAKSKFKEKKITFKL